jgi:hypothetical protein
MPVAALSLAYIAFTLVAGGQTPELKTANWTTEVLPNPARDSRREPRPALPALRYVNRPKIILEYELSKVGRSGIGSVVLWWTRNDGVSWESYGSDLGPQGHAPVGKQQATVELPGEGVYGFRLVVRSKAGLGTPTPQPGDIPDIRVEVDMTPPEVQLLAPIPDPRQPGALLIKWLAKDRNNNLTPNPVTLEYAKSLDGPWIPIKADLPNTGRYSWLLSGDIPGEVFIRVRVKDLASNESIAVTPEPQFVDLSEPEGRLLDVFVAPEEK